MPSILVTGANRGLGLEFARQYGADGWRVFACCRNPDDAEELRAIARDSAGRISLHALDVKDHRQVEKLAEELKNEPIDILLSNAGIYGPNKMFLGKIDFDLWRDVLAVNTLAPVKLAECFLDNVVRSQRRIIAAITSTMGSIALNGEGRHYLYRSSKAALNMAYKSLSIDLRPRGIIAVVLCPGWVRTDMGGPDASLSPEESIAGMKKVLAGLRLEDSGKFFNYTGAEVPW